MTTSGYTIPYSQPAYSAWGIPLEEYAIAKLENIEVAHDIIIALQEACETCVASYDGWGDCSDWREARQVWKEVADKCRAAIAKAQNEET